MEKEQSVKIIMDSTIDDAGKKKIPCAKAFEISRNHDISLKVIGEICEAQKIKINNCQLGCFK